MTYKFQNMGPSNYKKKIELLILRSEIIDCRWAGGFSLALVPVLLFSLAEASDEKRAEEPSTWSPLGQLVDSDVDCFEFLDFLWNF